MNKLFLLILLYFFCSCNVKVEDPVLATVNKKKLLLSNVIDKMPDQIVDSIFFINNYTNKWVKKELMLYQAEINLDYNLDDYKKQVDEYRSSLLIHDYQKELVDRKFDTAVSNNEIEQYYFKNINQFRLKKNIFKGRFIIVDKLAPRISHLDNIYSSEDSLDVNELEDYCQQFANEYFLLDSVWQIFNTITKKIPDAIDNEITFLKNKKKYTFEDNKFKYYLFLKDYQIKGSVTPLQLAEENIRRLMVNEKKIEFLQNIENKLLQDGIASGKVKIY